MKKFLFNKYAFCTYLILIMLLTWGVVSRMDHDYQAGQSYEEWQKKYLAEDAYYKKMSAKILQNDFTFNSVEFVFVGPGAKYFSRWGHVFIRFVGSHPTNKNEDLTLSFLVDANEYNVDNWKGFFGGKYRIYPLINLISDHINHYVNEEHRFLKFYKVNINEKIKSLMIENLRKYILNRDILGSWSFYNNNCTNLLNRYFKESGILSPIEEKVGALYPVEIIENYQKNNILSQQFNECSTSSCQF